METLKCMRTHCDGSHWGLTDWYPEIESGIREAIEFESNSAWTTGWYGSKKEIASACITHLKNGAFEISVSVCDDFDTNGYGDVEFNADDLGDVIGTLEQIRDAISKAWNEAEQDRKANAIHRGYKVIKDDLWIETYILDLSGGLHDEPPGDYYFEWGWQHDGDEIPDGVKDVLERWVTGFTDESECTCNGYTIKPWSEEES